MGLGLRVMESHGKVFEQKRTGFDLSLKNFPTAATGSKTVVGGRIVMAGDWRGGWGCMCLGRDWGRSHWTPGSSRSHQILYHLWGQG